jgi:D-galacturonate reductase
MLDLRKRGKVGRIGLVGSNGCKFPGIKSNLRLFLVLLIVFSFIIGIRDHLKKSISDVYNNMPIIIETYPNDDQINPSAYLDAILNYPPGSAVTIFTPDDTHYDIALACINRGLHVLVTKPAVKSLSDHLNLMKAATLKNVLVAVEVHKRWDPMYSDARDRIKRLGPFSFMHSYMSQPKHQLETFKSWAGKSSDISYYLNSHHIDFHEWCVGQNGRPISVTANASTGMASNILGVACEDTITLMVQWEVIDNKDNAISEASLKPPTSIGTAVYTSSWIAPRSDVHSQQRFFYMGHKGEIQIDQAHRGYTLSTDERGFGNVNPLFMKYTPCEGEFAGQLGYGYRSFEAFIDAVNAINTNEKSPSDYNEVLASLNSTIRTTAILEAGRKSLDEGSRSVKIIYDDSLNFSVNPEKLI